MRGILWTVLLVGPLLVGPGAGSETPGLQVVIRGPERMHLLDMWLGGGVGFAGWLVNRDAREWQLGVVVLGHWRLVVEGPHVDPRCEDIGGTIDVRYAGYPGMRVPPGRHEWTPPWGSLRQIVGPGRYRVWVEYDGTWIPREAGAAFYRGRLRSNTIEVQVLPVTGVDAELMAMWQEQHPGRPLCAFPLGMQPNIADPKVLLRDYPTSRYAAWVVVQQLGIVGFWKGVGKTRQAIARDARRRAAGCYRWYRYHTGRGDAPHWEAVYFPDTAWTRTSVRWLERILALHGDFPYREEVQASLAMRLLALGHLQRGIGLLRDLAQHARQQRMRRWAGVFLATWQQWMGQ